MVPLSAAVEPVDSFPLRRPRRRREGGGIPALRSRCVDSRGRVSCADAVMGTAEALWRIRWQRFSPSRCCSSGWWRGIGGLVVSGHGRRSGGGDHGMDFGPPASAPLRRRALRRFREACEALFRSWLWLLFSLRGDGFSVGRVSATLAQGRRFDGRRIQWHLPAPAAEDLGSGIGGVPGTSPADVPRISGPTVWRRATASVS